LSISDLWFNPSLAGSMGPSKSQPDVKGSLDGPVHSTGPDIRMEESREDPAPSAKTRRRAVFFIVFYRFLRYISILGSRARCP
jgi:hypothetical protein